jgi:hypothetical protein
MSGPRVPTRSARLGVSLAVSALPTRAERERYYCELVAELYGLPPSTQLRHAAGFVSQTLALRAALGASPAHLEELGMTSTPSSWRSFRCHVLRMHYWTSLSNPDGERYRACAVCRTERISSSTPFFIA